MLHTPLELVVANHAYVYAEICRRREARLATRERGERPRCREIARVRPDDGPLLPERVDRIPQTLSAWQRTVGGRRGRVGATEVVGGDYPQSCVITHRLTYFYLHGQRRECTGLAG